MFFKKRKRKLTKAVPFVLKNAETNKYVMAKKKANGVYEYIGSDTTDITSSTVFSFDENCTEVKISYLPEGTYNIIKEDIWLIFQYIAETIKIMCLACIFIVSMSFIIIFFLLAMGLLFNG